MLARAQGLDKGSGVPAARRQSTPPRLAQGLEQLGAARELTVEATLSALACAGLELREGSDAERAEVKLELERIEEIK